MTWSRPACPPSIRVLPAWRLLRQPGEEPPHPGQNRRGSPFAKDAAKEQGSGALRCLQCLQTITSESRRIAVAGSHQHVFANPYGIVFEIGCFSGAPGCNADGQPSPDFTWFPGMLWQAALCSACGLHLGWRYEAKDGSFFYGLILDRLVAPPDDGI